MRIDRLMVIWKEPDHGRRVVVGELWREPGRFFFAYGKGITAATELGFQGFPEFPLEKVETQEAGYLFPTFAQRIPGPQRPDRKQFLSAFSVEDPDDVFEILAKTGGIQITDNVELAECREGDDDLARPLAVRVAAEKHFHDAKAAVGDMLTLRAEPANAVDANAVLLLKGSTPVGHIPRQYSDMVAALLRKGVSLVCRVERELPLPGDRGRLVALLQRA